MRAERTGGLSIRRRGRASASGRCVKTGMTLALTYQNPRTGYVDSTRLVLHVDPARRLTMKTTTIGPAGRAGRPVTLFSATFTAKGKPAGRRR